MVAKVGVSRGEIFSEDLLGGDVDRLERQEGDGRHPTILSAWRK